MTNGRAEFGLVSLPDGRVLAAGGVDPVYTPQAAAELFDPSTGAWTATGSLTVATMWPAIQVLPDGRVLIAGGGLSATADRVTAICEIYTPATRNA
jgi:alkanesulfonate monooxygenase SsuD/methylene tetrahydromethanopterin reductase-like flavin-dependent oxidoreductase (luciferase family)